MPHAASHDDASSVRVANLPPETRESDLEVPPKPLAMCLLMVHRRCFPPAATCAECMWQRTTWAGPRFASDVVLVDDRRQGFAFVTFELPHHAEDAVRRLNRHGYGHLLLIVEPAG